ncbi:hypothetical protein [Comamonas kerstersii]|uniref:hypothetical protein n=1 Tax=Comamonas kerstersii TaxID=225992 RepID=UPI001B326A31|nr:hypothetical protein [Comamonas kerstersii]QTW18214.1 hypothetical protein H8N02_13645 [Comamonas kerstersii]
MTHTSTEQERAEFEAWALTESKWLHSREPSWMFHINECGDYAHLDVQQAFEAWQAARRAQVVPEGWKLVPEESTEAMARAFRADDAPYYFAMTTIRCNDFAERWRAVIAAAPQPSEALPAFQTEAVEAAPVQLQESISKVLEDCRSRAIDYATCPSPYNNTRMETAFQSLEHQVRQLLAAHAHGIKPGYIGQH